MKKKSDKLYVLAVILLGIAIAGVIASMIFEAVFNSEGFSETVEVACSAGACVLAFAGIVIACIRNKKDGERVEEYESKE